MWGNKLEITARNREHNYPRCDEMCATCISSSLFNTYLTRRHGMLYIGYSYAFSRWWLLPNVLNFDVAQD